MRKKCNDSDVVSIKRMTDAELSEELRSYQRAKSIDILLGVILVATGCIVMFVYRNIIVTCIPVFAGMALFLLAAQPAQKKKRTLIQQQLSGFFRTELTKAFGPKLKSATLPIDQAYLEVAKLSVISLTECAMADSHEGEYKGLRFSVADVELRRTVEEKSGPGNDDWITRIKTLFRGIVVRCKNICDLTLDIALSDMSQKRKKDGIIEPAVFRKHFSAHTTDNREANDQATPQLRDLVQKLEASSRTSKLCGLILRDGNLALALNTRYMFAGIPEESDLRDIDGTRKWFIASLTGMGNLLDLIAESPALIGATEQGGEYGRKKQEHGG